MALKKLKNNQYIKVAIDGSFKIYKTSSDRSLEKQSTHAKTIIQTYKQVIRTFQEDKERCYYDPTFNQLRYKWEEEFELYLRLQNSGQHIEELPLIAQYHPDVLDSLPTVILSGKVGVRGDTLEKVYDYVKKCGYFGEVEDC